MVFVTRFKYLSSETVSGKKKKTSKVELSAIMEADKIAKVFNKNGRTMKTLKTPLKTVLTGELEMNYL